MPLVQCDECGNHISSRAPRCPQCGRVPKAKRALIWQNCLSMLGLLAVLSIGGVAIFGHNSCGSDLPKVESKFCEIVNSNASQYRSASGNEMQRDALAISRAEQLSNLLGDGTVRGWIVEVESVDTSSNGRAILAVKVPCADAELKTWNNRLSDVSDGTMIDNSSPIFGVLMKLSRGQRVLVSAQILKDSRGFRETSLTQAGGMADPEFLVRFISVSRFMSVSDR